MYDKIVLSKKGWTLWEKHIFLCQMKILHNPFKTNRIHPEFPIFHLSAHVRDKLSRVPLSVWRTSENHSAEIEKSLAWDWFSVWRTTVAAYYLKVGWKMAPPSFRILIYLKRDVYNISWKMKGFFLKFPGKKKQKNSRIIVRKHFILYICLQITNYINLNLREHE